MRRLLASVLFLTAVVALPAAAEQVIFFSNGTTMPIRTHEVKGDMVKVDLGGNASMSFPMEVVLKIEEAGKNVLVERSTGGAAQRKAGGSYPVTGSAAPRASAPLPQRETVVPRGSVEEDGSGVVYEKPFAGSAHPGRAAMGAAGSQATRQFREQRATRDSMNGRGTPGSNRRTLPGRDQRSVRRGKPELTTLQFEPKERKQPGWAQDPPADSNAGSQEGGSTEGDQGSSNEGGSEGSNN